MLQCRVYAQSFAEVVLLRLANDAAWRDTHVNDSWSSPEIAGGTTFLYKLVDEADADLANDDFQPARLHSKVQAGDITRIYSVLISPPAPVNALTNAGAEDGLTDWSGFGCTLAESTDGPHGGLAYVLAEIRIGVLAGPEQEVTAALDNGCKYHLEVWVKATTFLSDQNLLIVMDTSEGPRVEYFSHSWSGTSWEKLSGALTVSWTGSLNAAYFRVNSTVSLTPFGIDDAVLIEVGRPQPVPGTWRREVE
jgi:hypothetical protein